MKAAAIPVINWLHTGGHKEHNKIQQYTLFCVVETPGDITFS